MNLTNLRPNWLKLVTGIVLFAAGQKVENYRLWHEGELTGWALIALGALALGVMVIGALVYAVLKTDEHDVLYATGIVLIAIGVGVGGYAFFDNADVEFDEILRGIALFFLLGVLLAANTLTTWRKS